MRSCMSATQPCSATPGRGCWAIGLLSPDVERKTHQNLSDLPASRKPVHPLDRSKRPDSARTTFKGLSPRFSLRWPLRRAVEFWLRPRPPFAFGISPPTRGLSVRNPEPCAFWLASIESTVALMIAVPLELNNIGDLTDRLHGAAERVSLWTFPHQFNP